MIAKTIRRFYDKQAKVMREADEEFEVTGERLKEINSTKYRVLVEAVKPEPEQEVKPEPKKAAKK